MSNPETPNSAFEYGPLDVVREIESEATQWDNCLSSTGMWEWEELDQVREKTKELTEKHPYVGSMVQIYGHALTFSPEQEGEGQRKLVATPKDSYSLVGNDYYVPRGFYHGIALRPVHYPELDYDVMTLVHVLASPEVETSTYYDEYWNHCEKRKTLLTYVPVGGSEVEPSLPLNLHSYRDLASDPALKKIDDLLARESRRNTAYRAGVIRGIGGIANSYMRRFEEVDVLKRQRVSCLNAMDVFDNLSIVSADYIIARRDDFVEGGSEDFVASTPQSAPMAIMPNYLEVASGCDRLSKGILQAGGPPELYATMPAIYGDDDSYTLFMPLKRVIATRATA